MKKIVGSRVLKTGVAIFITALICEWLDWPPVFAVITAIVTIEPTVSQSIKKGIVRFPASAIGSFYAVLFISLFGHAPITYALAAVFTIITTYRLKLYAGLLVATLTAVAMIEVIHTNVFLSFFIRLGTTTIGLVVSTLINLFVLPPDYTKDIYTKLRTITQRTGEAVEMVFCQYLLNRTNQPKCQNELDELDEDVHKIESLIQFQKDETQYHPLTASEQKAFQHAQRQLVRVKLMIYHLDNVLNTPLSELQLSDQEREKILESVHELAYAMKTNTKFDLVQHHQKLKELMALYWEDSDKVRKNKQEYPTAFPAELIVLYELVSIFTVVENYYTEEGV
ncbi:aromatic acid exporter family protein [Piscibacillus salipiscarius]|uniref:Aromatic acid exporter family protein n=1 Tax=Piscibacillus salipiscarius TaxID=299480 RepID=A0ABW5Q7F1_9BACI|nr:aromatic acid exporter family protein [Piscibacillus salipiscarius]